jgi:hypothetical protein
MLNLPDLFKHINEIWPCGPASFIPKVFFLIHLTTWDLEKNVSVVDDDLRLLGLALPL